MKYLERLHGLEVQSVKSRQALQDWKWTRPFLYLMKAQGSFLLWAWGLFVFQIAEIALLAFVHRMSFVPVSTLALRVLSSASLLPVLLSLWIAFQSGILYRNRSHTNSTQTKSLVIAWCKGLFLIFLVGSVLLTAGFVFFTDLHLSTPPIFRALVLSGIVSLPFDVVLVFLFLNLKALKPPELPRLRAWSLVFSGLALLALAQNWVTLFFFLKFVPKIVILSTLWTHLTGTTLAALWSSRVSWKSLVLPSLRFRFLLGFLGFTFLELGFLIATHWLLKGNPHWGILLYFVSRILHLGFILGSRVWLKTPEVVERRLHFWLAAWLCSFSLLPFLYLKRDVVFWALPTGERFEVTWDVIMAVVLVVSLRLLSLATWAKRSFDLSLEARSWGGLAWLPVGLWLMFLVFGPHPLTLGWVGSVLVFEVLVWGAVLIGFQKRRSETTADFGPVSTLELKSLLKRGLDWSLVRLESGLGDRSRFTRSLQSYKIWGYEIRQNTWLLSGAAVGEFLEELEGRVRLLNSQNAVSSAEDLKKIFPDSHLRLSQLFFDWPTYDEDFCRSYFKKESRTAESWMKDPRGVAQWRQFVRRVRLQALPFPDASARALSLKNWVWLMDLRGHFVCLARCEEPTLRAQLRAYCFDQGMGTLP